MTNEVQIIDYLDRSLGKLSKRAVQRVLTWAAQKFVDDTDVQGGVLDTSDVGGVLAPLADAENVNEAVERMEAIERSAERMEDPFDDISDTGPDRGSSLSQLAHQAFIIRDGEARAFAIDVDVERVTSMIIFEMKIAHTHGKELDATFLVENIKTNVGPGSIERTVQLTDCNVITDDKLCAEVGPVNLETARAFLHHVWEEMRQCTGVGVHQATDA